MIDDSFLKRLMDQINFFKNLSDSGEGLKEIYEQALKQFDGTEKMLKDFDIRETNYNHAISLSVERFKPLPAELDRTASLFRQAFDQYESIPFADLANNVATFIRERSYVSDWLESLRNINYHDIRDLLAEVEYQQDGSIALPMPQALNASDVKRIIDECLEKSLSNVEEKIEVKFNRLLEAVKELKTPFIKQLLLGIIIQIIVSLFLQAPIDNFKLKIANNNKQAMVRLIRSETQHLDRKLLTNYRLVVVEILNVRISKTVNSPIIGKLYFGYVVKIVEKRKNWSYVEWSTGDVNLRGWVLTRYIKQLH